MRGAGGSGRIRAGVGDPVAGGGQAAVDGALEKFAAMAKGDASPVVRLYLASAMQRTPVAQRMGGAGGAAERTRRMRRIRTCR